MKRNNTHDIPSVCSIPSLGNINSSPEQILQFLQSEGIINVGVVETEMLRKEKQKALKKYHPYSITKVGNRWQTFVRDESQKNNRRKVAKTNKDDLLDWLLIHYGVETQETLKRTYTIENLYPEWLKFKALHVSESYIPRIETDWKKYYEGSEIVSVPIKSLTKLQLDAWIHETIKKHNMTKTAYFNMAVIIRQILDYAVDLDIIEDNLFRKVRVDGRRVFRRVPKKAGTTQVFSDDEIKSLFELAMYDYQNARLKAELAPLAVIFQFQTGLRIGEVCALQWDDIDVTVGVIRVNKTIQRIYLVDGEEKYTELIVDKPKTKNSLREIPMTRDLQALVRPLKKIVRGDFYVLTNAANPTEPRTYRSYFNKLQKVLGLPKMRFHGLRHSFATRCIESKCDYKTVSVLLGHSNISTTLNLYVHPNLEQKKKCIDTMGKMFK